ncbi:MAG: helicase C-terminal domain-containing protein [Chloroflexota bacterium]
MMRLDQTYVALDLELTGLDPDTDAIIEVAAVKFRGGEVLGTWSSLVNPHRPLPHKIARLTGLQQAELNRAPSLAQVAGQLISFVRDFPIVGHSIAHDIDCLARQGVPLSNPLIDTFELNNVLLPQLSGKGLEALAQELGLDRDRHHRAADDAGISMQLFCYLLERALELDLAVVQEINRVAAASDWAMRDLFLAVERELSRNAFSGGSSLRQMMAAKGSLEEASLDLLMLSREQVEELQPIQPRREVPVDELSDLLGPEGPFAASFPGYEHRPQQQEVLRAVADAFNKSQVLLVEAGTGTGKSMAYLLPAARFAVDNGQHVVVSTKTINLQDQLFNKDVPDLQRLAPFDFTAALLKGRSNYLCLRRYGLERRRQDLSRDEAGALIKILVWLPTTSTGDYAEMSLTVGEKSLWPRLAANGDHCLGPQCAFYRKRTCFLYRARWQAAGAHLIVVNHALLLSEMNSPGAVLPDHKYLIVDEAHNLEDVATDQLGLTLGRRELEDFFDEVSRDSIGGGRSGALNDVRAALRGSSVPVQAQRDFEQSLEPAHAVVESAREAGRHFVDCLAIFLERHSGEAREYSRRLRLTQSIRAQDAWEELEVEWERVQLRLADVEKRLTDIFVGLSVLAEDSSQEVERVLQEIQSLAQRCGVLKANGEMIVAKPDANFVHWLEDASLGRSRSATLRAAPLHVGERLQRDLFGNKDAVVLTSATLSIAGQFDYVAGRLGVSGAKSLQVESPFDYKGSTLLYVPSDIPEPGTVGHQKAIERAIIELCRASEGRALILFTSHSQLATTFHAIRRPLQQDEILVIAQRVEGTSRRQLLRTFRSNPRTVLLGSASFWEGVDVVGDALSVLVIAKLPFSVPTDPVFAARSETFDDAFNEYGLPQTVLKFKQGFGRLIRSRNDRGVVVLLDRRVQTKTYGQAFLRSLPQCTVRRGTSADLPGAARAWLCDVRAEES